MKERLHKTLRHTHGKSVGFKQDLIILPNGKLAQRDYLTHPGAVGVLPFLDRNHVILVGQYRFPVQKYAYEIPAGKLDKGMSPDKTVRMELQEETGYRAKRWRKMLAFWPTAAFATELIHVYLAKDLTPGKTNPDEDEFIDTRILSLR
ncbi:MAG: ADP-ribose pyrophosphatase, partial [Candidatus Omnitrophica bacterium CG11_big_fil_rev_8_21_14_0_20_64_10]